MTVYAAFHPTNSSICASNFDVEDQSADQVAFSVVASATDQPFWPVFVGVCRGSMTGYDNNCFTTDVAPVDFAGLDEDGRSATTKAQLMEKSATATSYEAEFDFCSRPMKSKEASVTGRTMKTRKIIAKSGLKRKKGSRKRLRRELVGYEDLADI